ncbi:MAG: hypothetical protein J6U73_05400 [Alistipes sp.]|nr:hypothetical protein [Alistipes sp.]
MKRYLYTLFVALLFVAGCDIDNFNKPDVAFYFGPVTTETTNCSATVEVMAYMTVDEELYNDANVYLEYWKRGEDSISTTKVTDSIEGDTQFIRIFTINDLEPSTHYLARVVIDGGEAYGSKNEICTFITKQQEGIICDATVDAKGLVATVNLENVAYLVDDEPQQIAFLKLEYALAGANEWNVVEIAGSSIKNGKAIIAIPKSGDAYLEENSDYSYRVTITPTNSEYKAITTKNFSFTTTYAEITASISKPQLSYNDEGITIKAGNTAVYADGVALEEYTTSIFFRKQGDNLWEVYPLTDTNSVVVPADELKENTTYEAMVSIVAGEQSQVRESEIATITTPKNEIPVVPEPPTGGDTSTIAGVWHLTSWRGAEPSFDVYMDITATGGITLYQRIDSRYWDIYQSSTTIENYVISGVYTDNVAWGASYYLSIDSDTMTWTATNDTTDISIYTRSTLPSSMPTAPTRALTPSERFL